MYFILKKLFFVLIFVGYFSYSQKGLGNLETTTLSLSNINSNNGGPPNEQLNNQVVSIVDYVEQTSNFINLGNLNPDSNISLPAGIIKDVGALRYLIAIDSLKFKNSGAYFSAYAAIEFPGTGKKIAFRGSNIKFNPAGVVGGNQARLYLASTHVIQINPTTRLRLKGNGQNWVEWDCSGFKAINLVGNFEFSKNKLLPDSTQTSDTVVTASFQIYTEDIHNFITTVNISPFKIKGLEEWSFKVKNAVVDMSELSNAPAFSFPPDYPVENLASPQAWTGFAIQSLSIKLPKELSKTGHRTEILASNMQIDRMGLSGIFQINNLFNSNEGSMSGWAFSIEELGVGFVTNRINSGHIKGQVNIPICDSTQNLQYTANIHYNHRSGQANYNFLINPVSNVNFKVFNANVTLNNSSNISVIVQNGSFKPSANLSGLISFSDNKLNTNGGQLMFQNLTITSESPYLTNGVFSLQNVNGGQTKTGNFPVNINEITFGINQGSPVLGFSVSLNLSDQDGGSIGVGTLIKIKGKTESIQQSFNGEYPVSFTKPKFKFDKVEIDGVSINFQTGPVQLIGTVLYKDNDPVYGTGFSGSIQIKIPDISPTPIAVSTCFGNNGNYKYFYMDAKVNTRISLGEIPIVITKLIGGIYYHMMPNKTSEQEFISLNNNLSNISGNALTYVPTNTISMGMKTGASYECTLNQLPYNGDVIFEINFTNTGGIGNVSLGGDIYSISTVAAKTSAPVKGKIQMCFDTPNKTFDALAQVSINSFGIITGSGYFKLHIDPQTWYACLGRPTAPSNINFLNLVDVPFYCMIGNLLDAPLAPPSLISGIPNVNSFYGSRNTQSLQSGGGFCAGSKISAHMHRSFGFSFFQVTGDFDFDLGFDMMMANYGPNAHCAGGNDKIGMNGWLAEGSMYLAMNGIVSINGDFKFASDCPNSYELHPICGKNHCCCVNVNLPCIINSSFNYKIFDTSIAAVVAAKGPKPIYFAGAVNCNYDIFGHVKGDFNCDYSYGTNCSPVN